MTGFGLQAFETTGGVNCTAKTQDQLQIIDKSLQTFAATHSRFPKPARLHLGSNDPQFGYEAMASGATDPTSVTYATSAPGAGVVNASGVLIGAIPHATLGLPIEYATDCWGDKFTYAVTNSQTSSHVTAGYPGGGVGTIELRTGTLSGNQQLSPVITYVVVSHGQDKYGATPMSAGNLAAPGNCDGSTAGKIDRHNCNSDGVFYTGVTNTGDTDNYFDDLLIYSSKIQSQEDCPNQVTNWAPNCSGSTGLVLHGSSAVVTNTTANYTGTISVRCHDGTLTQLSTPTPACYASAPCPAGTTITWNASGAAASPCSAIVASASNHGDVRSGVNNSAAGYTGSVTVTCTNGAYTGFSPRTCTANPCTGGQSWGSGSACSGSVSGLASGGTQSVTNTSSGFSGSAMFSCTAGVLSITGSPTCTSTTNPCNPQSVSWGAGCSATTGSTMSHLGTQPVSFSSANYVGSATATCNNGTVTASGSCNAHCNGGGSVSWDADCMGTRPAIAHGNSGTVSNTASGYTGSATISCTNGSYSAPASTSCAPNVTASSDLFCWGDNTHGQFGNNMSGAGTDSSTPVASTNPTGVTGWKTVSAGLQHNCGIGSNDQAYCWGIGQNGQIGDNNLLKRTLPTLVTKPTGVTNWKAIAAGGTHSCAIGSNNQAYCWGSGGSGELGDNSALDRQVPQQVVNPSGVTGWSGITSGILITCGIGNNSQAYCWGAGGLIGDGTTTGNRNVPTLVINPSGVTGWKRLTASVGACGIGNNDQAYCWGPNYWGELGNNSTTASYVPTLVMNPSGVSGWNAISATAGNTCGIGNDGQAYCWGDNLHGQIGNNTTAPTQYAVPTGVTNPSGVTSWAVISAGSETNCGIGNNGKGYCWGTGTDGQIGNGSILSRRVPTLVSNPGGVTHWGIIASGEDHACAIGVSAPSCVVDGVPTGGSPANCCNGDSDGNGSCGTQPGICGPVHGDNNLTSAPSLPNNLCTTGTPSAVTGNGPYNWTCTGTPCSANRACSTPSGISWGAGCFRNVNFTSHGTSGGPVSNTAAGYTGATNLSCSQGVMTLSSSTCTSTAGVCGASNGGNFVSAPSTALCSSGTASSVTGSAGSQWTWNCDGAACSANRSCAADPSYTWNGAVSGCTANRTQQNHGFSGSLTDNNGSPSGSVTTSCSQGVWSNSSLVCNNAINGACGSSHGGTFSSAPFANLCNSGTASAVTGSGPWNWTCIGSGGGTTASCSATKAAGASCNNTMRTVEATGQWYGVARPLGGFGGSMDYTSSLQAYADSVCGAGSYMAAEWTYSGGKCNANFCAVMSCQLSANASYNILDRNNGCTALN